MSSSPLLGAAMIVRDEAQRLPACLHSLRGIVDEVVVVDTARRRRRGHRQLLGGALRS